MFERKGAIILDSCDIGFDARLLENDQYRWIESIDGAVQSVVDFNARERIVLPVMQSLVAALALHDGPQRALNLGMGGGALERALHSVRPDMRLTSVELSAPMVAIAYEHFFIPRNQDVVIAAADEFLLTCEDRFDLVFCDIFRGRLLPECLGSEAFYRALRDRLNTSGIFTANLPFVDTDALVALLLPLRQSFDWIAIYKNEGYDNVALFAARQRPKDWQWLQARLHKIGKEFDIDFTSLATGLAELPTKLS